MKAGSSAGYAAKVSVSSGYGVGSASEASS